MRSIHISIITSFQLKAKNTKMGHLDKSIEFDYEQGRFSHSMFSSNLQMYKL